MAEQSRPGLRGQSHVVGVALMLGLAVAALGTLTVGIGTLVDAQATNADVQQVSEGFEGAMATDRSGVHSHDLAFTEGQLRTEQRTLRILENDTVVETREIGALVFESGDRRVVSLAGGVIRDNGHSASFTARPSITDSAENRVLVVGAPAFGDPPVSIGGAGGISRTLRTNVSHERQSLGTGNFAVAIETETPEPFERAFDGAGVSTDREQFTGDRSESVVLTFSGTRTGYLVDHEMQLEVTP